MNDYNKLEKDLGYTFKNKSLLIKSLTHSSVTKSINSNERLEFLGDRVFGLVIAELLFNKFNKEKEGDLAKRLAVLTQKKSLLRIANTINLIDYLRCKSQMNKEELKSSDMLADAMEALIAVIYLDSDFNTARKIVENFWSGLIEENSEPPQDYKSKLQEFVQASKKTLPIYQEIEKLGEDHNPTFIVKVIVDGIGEFIGKGYNKKVAQQDAAKTCYHFVVSSNINKKAKVKTED